MTKQELEAKERREIEQIKAQLKGQGMTDDEINQHLTDMNLTPFKHGPEDLLVPDMITIEMQDKFSPLEWDENEMPLSLKTDYTKDKIKLEQA